MMNSLLHPGLIFIVAGLISWHLSAQHRTIFLSLTSLLVLGLAWWLPEGQILSINFLSYSLQPFYVDALTRLFLTVFSLTSFVGVLFAAKNDSRVEATAAFIYAGGAMSVVLAKDLITLFVFWEIMAIASTLIVLSGKQKDSAGAGFRYVLLHLLGGVILMVGIAAYAFENGTVDFVAMKLDSLATVLILIGFLLNAGAPPFSAWLADAYPEASYSGMVFLSAFTTKTAVYVLWRGFPGTEVLIFVGMYMIFYGIIYALLENDMRRILAYSIINQVGFMVCGIGIGSEMALNGAAAHAFTHIIYKALLLMSAGSVLFMTAKRRCTDLGGLIHSMPLTAICGIIGALAISSFPFTSGFVSKSMVTQGSADAHILWVWLGLQAASAGVFLHAGIKFPWFVFFQKDSGLRPEEPPLLMKISMVLFAFVCIFLGVFPNVLYAMLPYEVNYMPYTYEHVVTQLQLLLFSGLAFFLLLPLMKRTLTISLDFDWFYRKLMPKMYNAWLLVLEEFRVGAWRTNQEFARFVQSKTKANTVIAESMLTMMVVFMIVLLVYVLS